MNYYEHHIGDYQKKTAHLSMLEHAAYFLMLQTFYATEKPLPEGKVLYRIVRAESKTERDAVDEVVRQYWHKTPAGLVNGRGIDELAAYHEFIEKQRAAGKASGVKRSLNHRSNDRSTSVEPTYQPNGNQHGNQKATKGQPPSPTSHLPPPTSHQERLQSFLSKITHTSDPSSSVREPEKDSVCGTFKKIGGEKSHASK